jgi:hypothetical protein
MCPAKWERQSMVCRQLKQEREFLLAGGNRTSMFETVNSKIQIAIIGVRQFAHPDHQHPHGSRGLSKFPMMKQS